MNKKVTTIQKKRYDDQEDLEIKKIAYLKTNSQKVLFCVLLVLFGIMLGTAILSITKYYSQKRNNSIIEISNSNNKITIVNNETISKTIHKSLFTNDKEIVLENIDTLELIANKDNDTNSVIQYNVKYNIIKNEFWNNLFANSDSEVLVRFSYSLDGKNWNYINNVLSTANSTINPLVGNYYDVAGLETKIRVATNYELAVEPGEAKKIYWRSETIFQKGKNIDSEKKYNASFKIEYQDN